MLIKLMPDQVLREWEVIKYSIEQASYEDILTDKTAVRNHLSEILLGRMQVWAVVQEDEFVGVLVTRFSIDNTINAKRLDIYSLFGFKEMNKKTWVTCFVALKRFAKANKCSHIITLSDQPSLVSLANRLGADTSQIMIVFNMEE